MKKKLLYAFICVLSFCLLAVCLTACKEEKHEHVYDASVTAPTCTEQGYTTYTCACGDSYIDTYIKALGHSFTKYVSSKKATCTEDATKTATCDRDGCNETDTVTEEGTMLGHSFTNYISDNNATCTEDGTKTATCDRDGCNETDTVMVEGTMLAHTWSDNICNVCHYDAGGSKGLNMVLDTETNTYSLNGIGTCTDTELVIPSTYNGLPVTSISEGAFASCSGLTSITLPFVGATKDGTINTHFGYVFGADSYAKNPSCVPSSLKTVVITGGMSIGEGAFAYCSGLTSITIPDNVTSIGEGAFAFCGGLTSITIPDSVTSIGEFAFAYCGGLTSITIPDSVTSIGNYAFTWCDKLTSITIPDSVTNIGNYAFDWCRGLTSATIGNGVESIGEYAFTYCFNLTSVTIGNDVTNIGKYAFAYCEKLMSITIPDSMTSIGELAFLGCNRLIEVKNLSSLEITVGSTENGGVGYYAKRIYSEGDSYLSAENDYIIYNDGTDKILVTYTGTETNLILPSGITQINNSAFYACSSLISITIPDSVTSIGEGAFLECYRLIEIKNLSSLEITAGSSKNGNIARFAKNIYTETVGSSKLLTDKNGYVIYDDGTDKILVAYVGTETNLTLPSGLTQINEYAFHSCSDLTSITIPNSITSIGGFAFYDCNGLTSIKIPDSVTSIGEFAFYGCNDLTSVTIGNGVKSIGNYAFAYCDKLTSITIPDGVTSIEERAFCACCGLTSVNIGNGVTSIGYEAFAYCETLTSVIIGNCVESIGESAFCDCSGLTSIDYNGTMEQWNAISKNSDWNTNTGEYTVHCTDGDIAK